MYQAVPCLYRGEQLLSKLGIADAKQAQDHSCQQTIAGSFNKAVNPIAAGHLPCLKGLLDQATKNQFDYAIRMDDCAPVIVLKEVVPGLQQYCPPERHILSQAIPNARNDSVVSY